MTNVEPLFLVFSACVVLAGLTLVVAAVRAYNQTGQRVMIHLSIGFSLIVAATIATAFGAVVTGFQNFQTLLIVNNGFSVFGYLFVIYSVVTYN